MENGVSSQTPHQHRRRSKLNRPSCRWSIQPSYSRRTFIQRPNRARQRLIPLTSEIRKVMMDFNVPSDMSLTEKPYLKNLSFTSLVREEVHNTLQELSVTENFIRKEEIDLLIDRCLKEKKMAIEQVQGIKSPTAGSDVEINNDIEVTVEMLQGHDKNNLILENFEILEQRICTLEDRLSSMLQNIPKIRHLQAKKFKINTEAIKRELRPFMNKVDYAVGGETKFQTNIQNEKRVALPSAPKQHTIYDDIYYARREYAMNLLKYKKSLASLELNEHPKLNPYRKPVKMVVPTIKEKPKQKATFIVTGS